jgi:hypothetical protein
MTTTLLYTLVLAVLNIVKKLLVSQQQSAVR